MWDITYLNGPIKGKHYYLYVFSDLYSRKIVGWEVWKSEDAKHASEFQKDGQEKPETGVFQKKNG